MVFCDWLLSPNVMCNLSVSAVFIVQSQWFQNSFASWTPLKVYHLQTLGSTTTVPGHGLPSSHLCSYHSFSHLPISLLLSGSYLIQSSYLLKCLLGDLEEKVFCSVLHQCCYYLLEQFSSRPRRTRAGRAHLPRS